MLRETLIISCGLVSSHADVLRLQERVTRTSTWEASGLDDFAKSIVPVTHNLETTQSMQVSLWTMHDTKL